MNLKESEEIIIKSIGTILDEESDINKLENFNSDSQLIGGSSMIDSMALVQLCLELEDQADEIGFQFNWSSEVTMSKSKSMFRTVKSLAEEFYSQSKSQK